MSKKVDRKEALKNRTRTAVKNRDKKGLKTILNTSEYENLEMFKPRKGRDRNLVDILPFEVSEKWYPSLLSFNGDPIEIQPGELDYKLEVPIHTNIGANNRAIICLREAFGGECAICDRMFEEYNRDNPDKEITEALRPRWRCFYNVYDYNDTDKGIMIWDMSYHLFEKYLLEEASISDDEVVIFTSLEDGKSIEFKGVEKKIDKIAFIEAQSIEFKDRDPYNEEDLNTYPLDKMIYIPTPEEVKELFEMKEAGGSEEEEKATEDDTPSPTRTIQRGKKTEEKGAESPKPRERKRKKETNKCPGGGTFGADCNTLPECQTCPDEVFEACIDKQEEGDLPF